MARINTNVSALTAQRGLARSQKALNETLERLSSGLRINRGADDPAGLIASEGLRSEIAGINQAIDNSSRASNVIATAEAALNEVASLLLSTKELIVEAANSGALSQEEIEANQVQIDSAVRSITRISNTTTFAGLQLLNGSLDYLTSGVDDTAIKALHIQQANFGTRPSIPVSVDVVTAADTAQLQFQASAITSGVTLKIQGNDGVDQISIPSGSNAAAIVSAVNTISETTGVRAELINSAVPTSGVVFRSIGYGSKSFVSVEAKSGTFDTFDPVKAAVSKQAFGIDAEATINGALTVGDGLNIKLNTTTLAMDMTLDASVGTGQTEFTITGGGALFQLGPKVNANQQISIGIQSIAATELGDKEVGFLSDIITGGASSLVSGHAASASKIIERSIRQVAVLRGRLGAFEKNSLQTNINSLSIALENVTASESKIRDADFAAETSALTRAQILTQAGTSVLATANTTPQAVLALLQR